MKACIVGKRVFHVDDGKVWIVEYDHSESRGVMFIADDGRYDRDSESYSNADLISEWRELVSRKVVMCETSDGQVHVHLDGGECGQKILARATITEGEGLEASR